MSSYTRLIFELLQLWATQKTAAPRVVAFEVRRLVEELMHHILLVHRQVLGSTEQSSANARLDLRSQRYTRN